MIGPLFEETRPLSTRPAVVRAGRPLYVTDEAGKKYPRGRVVTFEGGGMAFYRDVNLSLARWVPGAGRSFLLEVDVLERAEALGATEVHYRLDAVLYCASISTFRAHGAVDWNGRLQMFVPLSEWRQEAAWYEVPGPPGGRR